MIRIGSRVLGTFRKKKRDEYLRVSAFVNIGEIIKPINIIEAIDDIAVIRIIDLLPFACSFDSDE